MTRATDFERFWVEFERPGRPGVEAVPPDPELAGAVATAVALHQHGEGIPPLDLAASWEALATRIEAAPVPGRAQTVDPLVQLNGHRTSGSVAMLRPRPRPRWTMRAAVLVAAAVLALGMVSLRAAPGSALYPVRLSVERVAVALDPNTRSIRLRVAEARLGDLRASLRRGPVRAAPGLARSLVASRAAAGRVGADLTDLDLRISLEVPPALVNAPPRIAAAVRSLLWSLLPPASAPSPSTGPGGTPGAEPNDDPGESPRDKGGSGRHDEGGEHRNGGGGNDEKDGGSEDDHHSGGGEDEGGDGGSSGSDSHEDRSSGGGGSGD